MKPLDFVITHKGNIAMIIEVSTLNSPTASIRFLEKRVGERSAWWNENELEIIGSLPDLLSQNLKHPSGNNSLQPFEV